MTKERKKLLLNSTQQVVARVGRDLALVTRLRPLKFGSLCLWGVPPGIPLALHLQDKISLNFPNIPKLRKLLPPEYCGRPNDLREAGWLSRSSAASGGTVPLKRVRAILKSPGHSPQRLSSARLLSDHSVRTCRARASLGVRGAREEKDPKGDLVTLLHPDSWLRGKLISCAGLALHLGKDNLPSPGIAFPAGAAFRGSVPRGAAGASGESGVREPALGGSGVAGARLPAKRAWLEARLPVRSFHAVGVRRFHSNFGESRFLRQRRCDQSESGDGNKLCKSPSGDGSDDSHTLKNYLAGSSRSDSGKSWLPGRAARVRADPVQAPSYSPPLPAAQISQVFTPTFTCSWLRPPLSGRERAAHFGSYPRGLLETPRGVLFFSPVSGKGVWRGRMRNSVPLLCLWSVYCCFAAGSSTPPGPEGRLQGNVHLFLLPPPFTPPPNFSVPRPLSGLPTPFQPLLVPAKSSCLSHCPVAPPNELCSSLAPWRF